MSEDYPKLTKKAQVLEVLKAGGYVVTEKRRTAVTNGGHARTSPDIGLTQLFNAAGDPIEAWQTAVVLNLHEQRFDVEDAGTKRIWRLKPC